MPKLSLRKRNAARRRELASLLSQPPPPGPSNSNQNTEDEQDTEGKPEGKDTHTSDPTTPVYFWKPDTENGWLGQWYKSPWIYEGEEFLHAEMWMMVGKARWFGDEDTAQQILQTASPRRAKALGRKVKGFEAEVWDRHKLQVVEQGNYLKFLRSVDAANLRNKLLETGERELVEASPVDWAWGIGFEAGEAGERRGEWGENLLGRALMGVRARLRERGKCEEEGEIEE